MYRLRNTPFFCGTIEFVMCPLVVHDMVRWVAYQKNIHVGFWVRDRAPRVNNQSLLGTLYRDMTYLLAYVG